MARLIAPLPCSLTCRKLALTAAAIWLAAFPALAAGSGTARLTLTGMVPVICSISLDAGTAALGNLATAQSALTVAHATETCNDRSGYTVKIATANGNAAGGVLKGSVNTASTLAYTVSYGGSAVTFAADGTSTNSAGIFNTSAATTSGGVQRAVAISHAGAGRLPPDTYSDTLTITIAGK